MQKVKDKISHTFNQSGRAKHGFTDPRVIKKPGKSQAEVNAGVLERIKREKPNLILCTNHHKAEPPQVFHTVQELRQMKANRVTGTRRFKG